MIIAFDTETCLVRPGLQAPPLVCATFCDGGYPVIFHHTEARAPIVAMLESDAVIVGHNIAFDMAVVAAKWPDLLPLIFEVYAADRITDTMLREKLIHIGSGISHKYKAKGSYSLEGVALRRTGLQLEKDEWRLRYAELMDVPLDEWPEGARDYALTDAVATHSVWEVQERVPKWLDDQYRQSRAAFWIYLMRARGMMTDPKAVARFKQQLQVQHDALQEELQGAQLIREDGTRDTKAAEKSARLFEEWSAGTTVARTATGKVALDKDSCAKVGLDSYAKFSSIKKQLSTDVPLLEQGVKEPIHPYFDSLLVTGRTSSSPNVQNLPRKGGMRECFTPRPGYVFASADYSMFELRTVSQVCVQMGWPSKLADALNAGLDPHLQMAALMLHISYEEAQKRRKAGDDKVESARQTGKVALFGFPGGLGYERFVEHARTQYDVIITLEEAKKLKEFWFRAWPEFRQYFAWVNTTCQDVKPGIRHFYSERYRGDVTYTEACNCLDEKTEALTKRGWVPGFDLKPGDFLMTKNAETGEMSWQPVTRLYFYPDYEGPLTEFRTKNFSAITTPNHRWLVQAKRGGKNICKTTEQIGANGDFHIHRTGDYRAPEAPVFTDDFVELVGWILTDGSLPKERNCLVLYQSQRANKPKVLRIDRLFDRLKLSPNRTVNARTQCVRWQLSGGTSVVHLLKEMFPEKVLTQSFLHQLTKSQLHLLFETMMLGDGTRAKTHASFCTGIKEAADQFQVLCTLIGKAAKVSWRDMSRYSPRSSKLVNFPRSKGVWHVAILDRETVQVVNLKSRYGLSKTQTAQRRDFVAKKPVWCVAVRNGFFVVRREGATYVTGNSYFQGLAADAAKAAGFRIAKACYVDTSSPLYGCSLWNFVHDEFIVEAPEAKGAEAAEELARLMVEGARPLLPDVPPVAEPLLARRWSKKAKTIRDSNGRLVPWDLKEEA